jgi:hypothetical protein
MGAPVLRLVFDELARRCQAGMLLRRAGEDQQHAPWLARRWCAMFRFPTW